MTTFAEWKSLPAVREIVPALVKIDLDKIDSWHAYKAAVYHADRSQIFKRAEKLASRQSGSELLLTMAILATMDYADLGDEIGQKAGIRGLLGASQFLDEAQRATVAGAIAMSDRAA